MVSLEELVPANHIYKKIQRIMGFYQDRKGDG